jgi:hypothetical protein
MGKTEIERKEHREELEKNLEERVALTSKKIDGGNVAGGTGDQKGRITVRKDWTGGKGSREAHSNRDFLRIDKSIEKHLRGWNLRKCLFDVAISSKSPRC